MSEECPAQTPPIRTDVEEPISAAAEMPPGAPPIRTDVEEPISAAAEMPPGAPPIRTDVEVPPGAWVCVLQGFYEGLELAVDRPWWVIGRGRGADAVLAEATISRAHAAIGFEPESGFFVQDLGSTNGTLVNGTRAERAPLRNGDELRMGRLQLRVGLPGSAS